MKTFLALLATVLIVGTAFITSADAQSAALVGMPTLDHAWNGDDYQHAANALELTKEPLPGPTDDQGRRFLRRLTATENLAPYKDHTKPFEQRVAGCYATYHAVSSIYVLYARAAEKGMNLHREAAELLAFMLRANAISFRLRDEERASMPKDDKYEAKAARLNLEDGITLSLFTAAMHFLSNKDFYTTEDLSILIESMADVLPSIKKALLPGEQASYCKTLTSLRAAFSGPQDSRNIMRMLQEFGCSDNLPPLPADGSPLPQQPQQFVETYRQSALLYLAKKRPDIKCDQLQFTKLEYHFSLEPQARGNQNYREYASATFLDPSRSSLINTGAVKS